MKRIKTKVSYTKDSDKPQQEYENNTFIKPLKSKVLSVLGERRNIKLPKYIYFNINAGNLNLYIKSQTTQDKKIIYPTCENMQTDNAAFEGWSITLKTWFKSQINNVILQWDIPSEKEKNNHYNRFLYRVIKFEEKYSWFTIHPSNINETKDFLKNKWQDLSVNVSTSIPVKKSNNENAVEYEICDKINPIIRQMFINKYDLSLFNHQLHVGVKSNDSLLFTGQQSAIDLWGLSNDKHTFSLFELKYIDEQKPTKNIKVGIISELFFYACVIEDIINGTIIPEKPIIEDEIQLYSNTKNINKINAFMLSNGFHPLLESCSILELLNNTSETNKIPIVFKKLNYSYKVNSYKFELKLEI